VISSAPSSAGRGRVEALFVKDPEGKGLELWRPALEKGALKESETRGSGGRVIHEYQKVWA